MVQNYSLFFICNFFQKNISEWKPCTKWVYFQVEIKMKCCWNWTKNQAIPDQLTIPLNKLPWQVSQAIMNRLLWVFWQIHQSLFGSFSVVFFSVEIVCEFNIELLEFSCAWGEIIDLACLMRGSWCFGLIDFLATPSSDKSALR